MKKSLLYIVAMLLTSGLNAQPLLTIEDAVLGMRGKFAAEKPKQLQWLPETQRFTQIVGENLHQALINTSVPSMKVDTLLSIEALNTALNTGLKSFPYIHWYRKDTGYFKVDHRYYLLSHTQKKWVISPWTAPNNSLSADAEQVTIDKSKLQIAYMENNNIKWITPDGVTHSVTNDTASHVVNGQSVHRNEFGISGGLFFSPKGNLLAFYRMDESMVTDYPIIDWSRTPAEVNYIKYPMAGQTSHQVSVGIYNPSTKRTVFLATGSPADQYLTCVTWAPDEQSIFVALLNREQNHMKLNQYNSATGEFIKTLFEEKQDNYVEPQHPLYFLPGSNNEFLWWSQRDGFMHLYRYDTKGTLLNQVTKGNWLVNEIIGFNTSKKEVIISASKESPLEKHLYKVGWRNGTISRLDNAPGIHQGQLSSDGKYLIDDYANSSVPNKTILVSTKDAKELHTLSESDNKLIGYQLAKVADINLKANDGTALYGKLMFPTDFDSSKTYPVIVYLYNGPHVQLVSNQYPASGNLWYDYLAQHGYFVFVMDGRGSSNRGLAFEQATFRELGKVEMEDQLTGVDYLKSLPYIDRTRMGVHGWSFGGFMATSLMLHHPGIFTCAVAGGPVIDWKMYEIMYTERYMDTPQENPFGYVNSNLLNKVENLQGDLLLIHGAQDDVVVWQHSIKFLRAAVENGIQVDYFVYPSHPHNVRGKDRVHLMQKVTDYFDLHLKRSK